MLGILKQAYHQFYPPEKTAADETEVGPEVRPLAQPDDFAVGPLESNTQESPHFFSDSTYKKIYFVAAAILMLIAVGSFSGSLYYGSIQNGLSGMAKEKAATFAACLFLTSVGSLGSSCLIYAENK